MGFFKLRWKIFLSMALVVGGLLLATLVVANRIIDGQSDETIRIELQNTRKVFEGLLKERMASLTAQRRVLAESPQLKAALDLKVQDPATAKDLGLEFKDGLGLDLLQVAGRRGALLASLLGKNAPNLERPKKDAKAA